MYPFERFTESAKRVLTLAQKEAERAHRSYIGPEHLLLGLLSEETGRGGAVLRRLGMSYDAVAGELTVLEQDLPRVVRSAIVPTSQVKEVIESSFHTARRMGDEYVGTEHIVLAVLEEDRRGIASQVLGNHRIDVAGVRATLQEISRSESCVSPPPRPPGAVQS